MTMTLLDVLIWIGTLTFAGLGALAGVARGLDLVGIIVVASVTAVGGGSVRDIVTGRLPPAVFMQDALLTAVVLVAVCVFLARARLPRTGRLWWLLDTLGLATFAALGAQTGLAAGFGFWGTMFAGAVSGVGGGMLRDVLVGRVPTVLTDNRDLYATAAALGAAAVWVAARLGASEEAGALLAATTRAAARRWNWHVPTALPP